MQDVGQKLREAYYQALAGNISYGGNTIPIVDEKLDVNINENDLYIMFTTQEEDAEQTAVKSYWSNECTLSLQVVNNRQSTNTKEAVEDVSSQILNTLFPVKNTNTLSIGSPFKLTYAKFLRGNYNPLIETQAGFFISKVLTFKNRITQ